MTDVETLAERVRTVERAVTDGDHTFPAVDDIAELTERVEAVERRVEELDERTAELEGATQALRGYVGNVRSVNERVEQRADTALAATERLERRLDADDASASNSGCDRRNQRAEQTGRTQHSNPDAPSTRQRTPDPEGSEASAIHGDHSVASDGPTGNGTGASAAFGNSADEFELGGDTVDRESGTDDADDSAEAGVLERMRSLL